MGDFILNRFICKTYFEEAEKLVVMRLSLITETQIVLHTVQSLVQKAQL